MFPPLTSNICNYYYCIQGNIATKRENILVFNQVFFVENSEKKITGEVINIMINFC